MKQEQPLSEIRTQITEIDQAILNLLFQRRECVKAVFAIKMQHQLPLRDPKRETELLEKLTAQAKALDLNPHFITQLYQLIIKDSVALQQQWQQNQA